MADIGLTQDQIDSMLGEAPGSGAAQQVALGEQDIAALVDIEHATMGNLPSVLNAMTGFEYRIGTVECSRTEPGEIPTLLGSDLVFGFPVEVGEPFTHFLSMETQFAKRIAAALTGAQSSEDTQLSDMEVSAISEVVSQANGSYLSNLSATLKVAASGAAVQPTDAAGAASALDSGAMIASIYLEGGGGEPELVRHILPGVLVQLIAGQLRQAAAAQPPPTPAPTAPPPPEETGSQELIMPQTSSASAVVSPTTQYSPATFSQLAPAAEDVEARNLDILLDVPLQVTVELGKTQIPIKQILEYGQGSLITLDKLAGEPIDLLVNGKYFAKGEVVVIDESFGVRITSILTPAERLAQLS